MPNNYEWDDGNKTKFLLGSKFGYWVVAQGHAQHLNRKHAALTPHVEFSKIIIISVLYIIFIREDAS
jgi:hypothetical protein